MPTTINYIYTHASTEATTGYFSCEPQPSLDFEQCLDYLAQANFDDFLHRYALNILSHKNNDELQIFIQNILNVQALQELDLATLNAKQNVFLALIMECIILYDTYKSLEKFINASLLQHAQKYSPLPYLAWFQAPNKDLHTQWAKFFYNNINNHGKLPHPEEEELPALFSAQELSQAQNSQSSQSVQDIFKQMQDNVEPSEPAWSRPPAQETAQQALDLLTEHGILAGIEMRHEASLSPMALLRDWKIDTQVTCGALNYTLQGTATAYGRGLSLAATRASYAMEIVERASTYVSIRDNKILNRIQDLTLIKASYAELLAQNKKAMQVPDMDTPLYWLEGLMPSMDIKDGVMPSTYIKDGLTPSIDIKDGTDKGHTKILVPAQCVFLFNNLDEKSIFMNAGSTGLASGNTLDEAKLSALTEILERDAEAVIPYDFKRCFTLVSQNPKIQALLDDYAYRHIHVQFLDLSTEFGIPCYQAFVLGKNGQVYRATGANLCGEKAILSALTEVPYPYPHGEPTMPAFRALPQRILENLPDYSLKSPALSLKLLEKVLHSKNYTPIYVDISRKDLKFPVVRCIVPNLELSSEWDNFSTIPTRLYENYLNMFK